MQTRGFLMLLLCGMPQNKTFQDHGAETEDTMSQAWGLNFVNLNQPWKAKKKKKGGEHLNFRGRRLVETSGLMLISPMPVT